MSDMPDTSPAIEELPPTALNDFAEGFSAIAAASSGELSTIQQVTVDHLRQGPHVESTDPVAHVAEHLEQLIPAVMKDARVAGVPDRILVNMNALKAPAAPGPEALPAVALAGGGAAVIIGLIAVGAAWYCLGGDAPEPGTSVEVRC
jgi:hypothetical protein